MVGNLLVLNDVCCRESTGDTLEEFVELFKERVPYTTAETIGGTTYIWEDSFIVKVQNAMSNEDLSEMNPQEIDIWYGFVDFQNNHSNYPDSGATPYEEIGCTIPDAMGNSYTVYLDAEGVVTTSTVLCNDPLSNVPRPLILASLDDVMLDLINCDDYNSRGILEGDITDVSPCPVDP